MSVYSMMFMGMAPFGALSAGALAHRLGAPFTVALGGVACIAAAIWFARHMPSLRAEVRELVLAAGPDWWLARAGNHQPGIVVSSDKRSLRSLRMKAKQGLPLVRRWWLAGGGRRGGAGGHSQPAQPVACLRCFDRARIAADEALQLANASLALSQFKQGVTLL